MAKEKVVKIEDKEYKFVQPTLAQSSAADFEYSKAYTMALNNGLLPRITMERKLAENGIWGDKENGEIELLGEKMRETLEASLLEKDVAKKEALLLEFYKTRQLLFAKTTEKQTLLAHTADSKGDEAKIVELIWQCVLDASGKRIWGSKDEFLKNVSDINLTSLINEFVSYITGVDQKINDLNELVKSSYERTDEDEKGEGETTENKVEVFGTEKEESEGAKNDEVKSS